MAASESDKGLVSYKNSVASPNHRLLGPMNKFCWICFLIQGAILWEKMWQRKKFWKRKVKTAIHFHRQPKWQPSTMVGGVGWWCVLSQFLVKSNFRGGSVGVLTKSCGSFFLDILYIYNIGQYLKKDQDNISYDIPISNNSRQYLKKGHHFKKSEKNLKTRLKSKVFSLESWDIADMDKCPQEKYCMDKCHGDSCNLLYMFPGPFI